MKKIKNKPARSALVFTVLILLILLTANLIVSETVVRYPLKADMTRQQLFALTEDTERILHSMKKDVSLYLIQSEKQPIGSDTVEVIDRYRKAAGGRLTVESVDLAQNPTFAKQFPDATLSYGSVLLVCGDRYRALASSGFISSDGKNFSAENKLTNALLYVLSDQTKKVCLMTGHGEKEFGILETLLNQSYYTVSELQLLTEDIPSDAQILLCISPITDFSEEEVEKLDAYLKRGGNVQFYFDVGKEDQPRLRDYLAEWGIRIESDYLYETDPNRFYGTGTEAAINLLPTVEAYAFTSAVSNNSLMIAPFSSSLTLSDKNIQKAEVVPLLSTSEKAFARTDFSAEGFSETAEGDRQGIHCVSALAVRDMDSDTESDLMVTGTSQILLNSLLEDNSTYANSDYFLNSIAWMSGAEEAVKISPKLLVTDKLKMSVGTGITFTVVIFAISLVVLIIGVIIWARRRFL